MAKNEQTKTVRLVHSNGAVVVVPEEGHEALLGDSFAVEKPAAKRTSSAS
jgi:hypothetical protein